METIKKYLWQALGFLMLGCAYIGVVTPGIPFSFFLVIAAFEFARSSPKMHKWLYSHKYFGPFLTNWGKYRVFPLYAKYSMIIMMSISLAIMWHSLHNVKGNIWFEKVFNTGTTFSINYERFQSLNESGHYDTLFFKFGHISEEDAELALNFNPLQNYDTNLSYKRNINGFDITFGSNYTLMSEVPDYDVNLKISNKY